MASSRRVKPTPPPKQKGSKDKVPHGRTIKASVKAIIQEVVNEERMTVRDCLTRGLKAGPRDAHHYLKLAAQYIDGNPETPLTVNFDPDELASAKGTLEKKLDILIKRIAEADATPKE